MNVLDENILDAQVQRLRRWRVRVRHIGRDLGRKGLKDDEIRPFLAQLRRITFFTRDVGYYQRRFCHSHYCLIVLAVHESEVAEYTCRLLRHPAFSTQAKRMGMVVRASSTAVTVWRLQAEHEETFACSA
ncbi:MAG: DUF5615 family PIN-like protein [Dehalococcoidia bacterium]